MPLLTRRTLGLGLAAAGLLAPHALAAGESSTPPAAMIEDRVTIGSRAVAYRAIAAEQVLRGAGGEAEATFFGLSYLALPADPRRPVTFLFNGGPGGATIALREGLGPKVTVNAEGGEGFAFVDNPDSILDVTDLVFVDPAGVGYSRFLNEAAKPRYYGVEEDARAVAAFIQAWLKLHGREASPKFLVGESYAGVRVGVVARLLAEAPEPVDFQGVVLVSPSTATRGREPLAPAADPAIRVLPSQAAAAHYHGKGDHTARPVLEVTLEAQAFAEGPYAQALAAGEALSPQDRQAIAAQAAGYLGFAPDVIAAAGLRLDRERFMRELLADEAARIGLSDARAKAPLAITETKRPPYDDPSTSPYTLTYDLTAANEGFYRQLLGYQPLSPYVRLSYEANGQWNWEVEGGPLSMPLVFKDLMARAPQMRVALLLGAYDLNIPYAGPLSEYLAADLPQDRFEHRLYAAGHAVFSDAATRAGASDDLRRFYAAAIGG